MCTDICFICNSRPRQLKVPQVVPPYGRSEGESETEELSLSEPGVRRAALVPLLENVCCVISRYITLSLSPALELPASTLPVWGPALYGMKHGMDYDYGRRIVRRLRLDYTDFSVYNGQPSTAFTVSFVHECDTRAMSSRLTRSVLHGGGCKQRFGSRPKHTS